LELLTPGGNRRFRLEAMQDRNGRAMSEVPGGGWQVRVPLPVEVSEMALLTRFL
jgi:putative protease